MTGNLTQRLIDGLSLIPNRWQIVPTNGNKQPLGYRWQLHPFNKDELIRQLLSTGGVMVRNSKGNWFCAYPKGIGVLTGKRLVAVDVDGKSAMTILLGLSKDKALPPTVAFTSGKPFRCQYLFSIPAETAVRSHRIKTRLPGEGLEIRGAGMMSVLPPSVHPQTGQYRWVAKCSPVECAIAPAPDWLIGLMMQQHCHHAKPPKKERTWASAAPHRSLSNSTIAALLAQLAPWRADDYHEWIRIGMCLYSYSPSLLPLWDEWSRQSNKYKFGECESKWSTFNPNYISLRTLHYLARLDSAIPNAS